MKTPTRKRMQWTEVDVKCGMIVCRRHLGKESWKPEGWTAKWTHKIGFCPHLHTKESGSHYCQIAMTDGMVYCTSKSLAEMAQILTEQDMIPMPWTWWQKMVKYLRSQSNPIDA